MNPSLTAVVGALIASGVVDGCGPIAGWPTSASSTSAAARFERPARTFGELAGRGHRSVSPRDVARAVGHLRRRDVNRDTGDAVMRGPRCVGRPGPISIHTPDACYAASGYEVTAPVRVTPWPTCRGPAEFWTTEHGPDAADGADAAPRVFSAVERRGRRG